MLGISWKYQDMEIPGTDYHIYYYGDNKKKGCHKKALGNK
jgi:hypothetical protein